MDISEIKSFLEDNDLSDVEEIKQEDDYILLKFYYDFDKDELMAAKSYSNEESDFEAESDEWYNEYYIPFLKDIADDNVESIVEDAAEEFEIEGKYKSLVMESGELGYLRFVAVFSAEMDESEMEDILNDYVQ
ncbi:MULTISPECIES: hypothetical protein [Clostridium]|uniref:Uncharacterized protein n=1 Tax=Clostridium butyricum TaxID=1492 RepID=A0A0A6PRY6_CLOBU|nr:MULTISPECIES: hypothetical protein [Clostridium]ETI88982.1 MAG: hypothetical protein Q607_CBUC00185G0044 [Clostridium butyricum DORA_1]ALP91097.1 hypothetical protein ATN24_13440 [Clostridium butyricum]ALS17597.1 hypothetical protein ATD26_12170 [Clostridium butyricum]ANF14720.1 hypothetical protein AZ909_11895 [Clostridium butyricum]AOR94787.1 hypothetical protein BBB49_12080 [Clostridium butyricum]